MTIIEFPPVEMANEDGLLALGGDLDPESLLLAYRSGIFPWPLRRRLLAWFSPPQRAVLFLDRLHVPHSLAKFRKHSGYTVTIDRSFESVIRACAAPINRGDQRGTWITPEIIEAYTALHHAGFTHSVECWDGAELIGGLYGVSIGRMFAGESMFYRKKNASKLALLHVCEHLRERGAGWLDCQVMTPMLQSFGAAEIERERFMELLREALATEGRLF